MRLRYIFYPIVLLASACASNLELTVITTPSGALVTQVASGEGFGVAPTRVFYESKLLESNRDAAGCHVLQGFQATWGSRAKTVMDPVRICGEPRGQYTITLGRDPNVPGLQQDLEFAMRLQESRSANLARALAVMPQQQPVRLSPLPGGTLVPALTAAQPLENRPGHIGIGFLMRHYVSGFNRICIYSKTGGEVATTIASYEACPQTIP